MHHSLYAFRYVFRFIRKNSKFYLFLVGFCQLLTMTQVFLSIYFPKVIIDGITGELPIRQLVWIVAAFCLVLLACRVSGKWLEHRSWLIQVRMQRKLICSVMEKTARIDYELLESPDILDLKARAEKSYLGNASDDFFGVVKHYIAMLFGVFTIVGILITLSGLGVIYCLFINLIVIGICVVKSKTLKKNYKEEEEAIPFERRWQYYRDLPLDLKAIKEIKIYDISDWLVRRFDDISKITGGYYAKILGNNALSEIGIHMLTAVRDLASYIYVVILAFGGKITLGSLSMYISAIENYTSGLQELIEKVMVTAHVGQFIQSLEDYLALPESIRKDGHQKPAAEDGALIEFDHVYFRYPNSEKDVLQDICFRFEKKEHISLVGENGAGKTTLIKLLCRLYRPTSGEIRLNGVNIFDYQYDEYMRLLSAIFQDYQLFSMSLAENLAFGAKFDAEKATRICHSLGIPCETGFEQQLTKLFDPKGLVLSGGQQQKFAIARALYWDQGSIVIFDEPTSALDARSEATIYDTVDQLCHGKTAIFISHRLSSCVNSDRIIVLKNGAIFESGTHEELMKKQSYYAELFELQASRYLNG